MAVIEISVIFNCPGLPYRPAMDDWESHVSVCGQCQGVLQRNALTGGFGDPTGLCISGKALDQELRGRIAYQRETCELN